MARLVVVLAALLLLPLPASAFFTEDDAGSGADAPNARGAGPFLADGEPYWGNLTPGDAWDWYRVDLGIAKATLVVAGGVCIELRTPAHKLHFSECYAGTPGGVARTTLDIPLEGVWMWGIKPYLTGPRDYRIGFGQFVPPPVATLTEFRRGDPAPVHTPPGESDREPRAHDAVIALIDSGINPYHAVFREAHPRAHEHPSTYIPGYPADALPLPITFGFDTLADSLAHDCAIWESVVPDQLYYFPGTRIVGAIVVSSPHIAPSEPASCDGNHYGGIVAGGSHGTMTASRAAGNGYGACPECLIVMLQGYGAEYVEWAASQPWIDLQSNSWGPIYPVFFPAEPPGFALLGTTPDFARRVEAAAQAQASFWASGNGAAFRLGVLGHPTQLAPHMGPSVLRVGGDDSGRVNTWPGSAPHVISDSCSSWAAVHGSTNVSTPTTGGGTSGATPFAAGVTARVLLEARALMGSTGTGEHDGALARGQPVGAGPLADGVLTRAELLDAVFSTADPRGPRTDEDGDACNAIGPYMSTPLAWSDVPEGAHGIQFVGYGKLTKDTAEDALAVLVGEAARPDRTIEDAWFAADRDYRALMLSAYGALP